MQTKIAELKKKLAAIGHHKFEVSPDEEDLDMLYIAEHFICGVDHALSLSEKQLSSLITETLRGEKA